MSSLTVFAGLAVLAFGLSILLEGLFTAYFGAGKSRKTGIGLTLTGLVVLAFFVNATWNVAPGVVFTMWTPEEIGIGLAAVAGAVVGGFVAMAAFLISIMKA